MVGMRCDRCGRPLWTLESDEFDSVRGQRKQHQRCGYKYVEYDLYTNLLWTSGDRIRGDLLDCANDHESVLRLRGDGGTGDNYRD